MIEPTQVEALLNEALPKSPAEREAFLDHACGGNHDLRQEVERLLAAHPQAEGFLDRPAVHNTAAYGTHAEVSGTVIGPYKLLEQIGEGGMGTVWMAQQTEPVKRVVAVKLIKAGMDSKQVIARFEAERQALALMDHANIARVLDAGATSTGRPYFVMDLVKGVPITRYCDEHRLTPRQRLELFIPVCQAVQHAHQKGIIHRDIKPSNVLIALYDGKPVPKIIDFGVAKAAGQQLTDKTLITGFGNIVGTLEYMSPEQAEFNQLDIDTRSDIYSLGVLLYELLAGSPPFSRTGLEKAGMFEMLRVIREQEPSKPSTKLSTADGLPTLAANRGTEPAKLTKLVRGELDWIVMKALEKDRNRRYETANGFAADVQRYLTDEPVQACPPSMSYRLRKWTRRHRPVVLAAAGLAALLIAVAVGATVAAFREQRLKREAVETAEALKRTLYFEHIALAAQRLAADQRNQVDELLEQCPAEMRDWEWNFLKHWLQADAYVELRGHTEFLTTVAFHPNGRRLVSAGADSTIRIWDRTTGKQTRAPLYGHFGTIIKVAFTPDGRYLVSAGGDKTVKIWDAETFKVIHTLKGHEGFILGMALSPDGRLVASCGRDKTVRICEVATGLLVHVCQGHEWYVRDVAFNPDGSRLVSLGGEGTVKVWDVATWQETLTWRETTTSGSEAVAISPDGQHVAVASGRDVHVHALADGRVVRVLQGHFIQVFGLAYSPDGRRLATASWDNTVKLWDPDSGREILTLRGHTDATRGLAFSPDGRHLATASHDQTIRVWNAMGETEGAGGLIRTVRTAPDRNQNSFALFSHPGLHPDGRRIPIRYLDGKVRIWDVSTAQEVGAFHLGGAVVYETRFSPDGGRLSATDINGNAKVWDMATRGEYWSGPTGREPGPGYVRLSPDNRWLACGEQAGGAITIRDLSNGRPLKSLSPVGQMTSMEFSPDGRLFAACGTKKTVVVWKTDGFQELWTLKHPDICISPRFSPDCRRLVIGGNDRVARIWDLQTGKEILTFREHKDRLTHAEFSPDGRAVTSAAGTEALVWSAADGRILRRYRGHAGMVVSAQFSPDGKWLVTSGDDDTLRVWDATLSPLDWHGPEARKLVDERFAKLPLRNDVVESLRTDKAITDEVRDVALQLAEERYEDPFQLVRAAYDIVKKPGGRDADLRQALRLAEASCRLHPSNGAAVNTLALVRHRLGEDDRALTELARAEVLNAERFRPWPRDLAVLALVQIQFDRIDQAKVTLGRLRDLLKEPKWVAATESQALLAEAEVLLEQKDKKASEKP